MAVVKRLSKLAVTQSSPGGPAPTAGRTGKMRPERDTAGRGRPADAAFCNLAPAR